MKGLADIKDFFTQNKIFIAFSFVILAVFFCWLFWFLFPQLTIIKKTQKQLKILKQKAKEPNVRKTDFNLLRKKNVDLKKQIDSYKISVLSKEEITSLLGYLSRSATKSGSKISAIKPSQEDIGEGDYLPLYININLEGEFRQLVSFISLLENCNKFIDIKKITVIALDNKRESAEFILKSFISAQKLVSGGISSLDEILAAFPQNPFSVRTAKTTSVFQSIHFLEDIYLQGIVYEQENSLAIINGRFAKEGEQLGSFKLKTIGEREILLIKEGEEYVIKLGGNNEQI
ncbi:MAG: type 4a pilus biogenesis protein PilO [Candidatus Omnitrophica bacterium]|nr:type 4a pilus biogenesis protein PilO [Candidatus Omnitrophota bacterium]